MPISTINQNGLNAPLTLTSPVLTTPNLGTPSALVLTNATALPKAALPTGSVLQVVNYTGVGYAVSSTSTWADVPDLSLAITPQFSTSKILVISTIIIGKSTSNTYAGLRLVRGSTVISTFSDVVAWTNSSVETTSPVAYTYLDSPATTSSTTYKIEYNSGQNSTAVIVGNYINSSANTKHSITLMEIAA